MNGGMLWCESHIQQVDSLPHTHAFTEHRLFSVHEVAHEFLLFLGEITLGCRERSGSVGFLLLVGGSTSESHTNELDTSEQGDQTDDAELYENEDEREDQRKSIVGNK